MICFIDGPFIKEHKYDLVHLGIPNVDLDEPAFRDFDQSSLKTFELTQEVMVAEDFVFILAPEGAIATVDGKQVVADPCDLLAIYPNTEFSISGNNLSSRSMKTSSDLTTDSYSFVGRNCRFSCNSTTIFFDNLTNKKLAIGKLYDIPHILRILPTLTFQTYSKSSNLFFPDRRSARFVFSVLVEVNKSYSTHIDETILKSQSHLISVPTPPMSEREDLEAILRWMKEGFQLDYHSRSVGNIKLF